MATYKKKDKAVELTPQQRKLALAKIKKMQRDNPLRRVKVACCIGWRRDPLAEVGDWIWCDTHQDKSRVIEVES